MEMVKRLSMENLWLVVDLYHMETMGEDWKDLKKGKEISVYGVIAKLQKFLSKILPHKLIMNIWLKQQKLK